MGNRSLVRTLTAVTLLGLAGGLGSPRPGSGQALTPPRFGIGYVANGPDLLVGGGGYVVLRVLGGIGFFADMKVDLESPSRKPEFLSHLTARQVEAQVEGAVLQFPDNSWRSFNIGLVRPVSPWLMLYAGGGYAIRTRYRAYQEPSEEMGFLGFFWVEAPEERKTTINTMFGGFMRISRRLAFQIGIETAPRGLTVGAFLGFPGW
jgi:hypothetical protein